MRYLYGGLALVLLLFAGLQYNDPDFYLWIPLYLVPALWAGAAALRPGLLGRPSAVGGLTLCLAAALVGTAMLWPSDPEWWRRDVWWESETAREGMGMMIIAASLLALTATAVLQRRSARSSQASAADEQP